MPCRLRVVGVQEEEEQYRTKFFFIFRICKTILYIMYYYEHKLNKENTRQGVINDPLGQTNNEHCFLSFVLIDFKSGDGRTDMCEKNYSYRPPWLWVGRVDQYWKEGLFLPYSRLIVWIKTFQRYALFKRSRFREGGFFSDTVAQILIFMFILATAE